LRATCVASAFRSAYEISSAAGRAISTTSNGIPRRVTAESPNRWVRLTSRNRRRARLRSTEPLIERLTVMPTRLPGASLGTAKATNARPLYTRLPLTAAWKSARRRSRKRLFTREEELGGQPLTALTSAVADHARTTAGAHPAQKTVHAPAIAFLGLVCSLDRGSVPK